MDSDPETEDSFVMNKTWDKMANSVHKIGFVEGLSSGKESVFQSGFDKGYAEGFDAGYTLAKLNGVLRALQESCKEETATVETLKQVDLQLNCKKGLCLLCNPQNMEACLQEAPCEANSNKSSLGTSIKSQQLIVQQAVDSHFKKSRDMYMYFNIAVPLDNKALV